MAKTLLDGLNNQLQRGIFARVCRITRKFMGKADEDEAKALASEVAAPAGSIDVMAQCAAEIAQKYDLIGQWTPEAMFIVAAGTWGMGVIGVNRRLDALEARLNEANKPEPQAKAA